MTPITHTFTVRSLVSRPLTVDRLQGSCRCTTAVVEGTSNDGPFTLPPGGRARIQVIISPGDALPGPFEKEVYVFAGGDTSPTAILQMAGTLTSPVTFSPSSLDFGQITAKTAPQTITVTVDTRLLATGQTPRLSSDSRDLTLTAVPSTGVKSLPGTVSQTYRVMVVPHPRQKSLRASLHLVPANAATPPFGFDTWGTASVTGEVASGR